MPTTRTTILKAIKTALATVSGLDASRVHIGAIDPSKAESQLKVMVWWRSDKGMRKDGDKYERRLRVIIAVLGKVNRAAAATETDLLQMGDLYDAVHAKLESIADTAVGGAMAGWQEAEPGIEPVGFDLVAPEFYVGCAWDIEYDRARAAT